jgi:hypothetical protein
VWEPVPEVITAIAGDVVNDQGRYRLANLVVQPRRGRYIDSHLWRIVPVAKVETMVNDPLVRHALTLTDPYTPGVYGIWGVDFKHEWAEAVQQHHREQVRRKPSLRLDPLPTGPRYPDGFYRKVSAAYTRLAHEGRPPAETLAATNGVPKTTVNRWVREARRRGLLAPAGGKGRIG